MKKMLWITMLLGLTACKQREPGRVATEITTHTGDKDYKIGVYNDPLKVIKIDGCEYLYGDWGKGAVLTHKGNCRNIHGPGNL